MRCEMKLVQGVILPSIDTKCSANGTSYFTSTLLEQAIQLRTCQFDDNKGYVLNYPDTL